MCGVTFVVVKSSHPRSRIRPGYNVGTRALSLDRRLHKTVPLFIHARSFSKGTTTIFDEIFFPGPVKRLHDFWPAAHKSARSGLGRFD